MILLYHNLVPPNAHEGCRLTSLNLDSTTFKNHMQHLVKYFNIVTLDEYVFDLQKNKSHKKKLIAITFDDGTATSFEYSFPVLNELSIPATFFVTTCHLNNKELMPGWYINALCFGNIYNNIEINNQWFSLESSESQIHTHTNLGCILQRSSNPRDFTKSLQKKYPLPESLQFLYSGMIKSQFDNARNSQLIEIGAHTVTHPNLSNLSISDQKFEIVESMRVLAELTGKPVKFFAYPGGDYNSETISIVKEAGLKAAFAVNPSTITIDPSFEIGRIGIYSPSLFKLHLKAIGFAAGLRQIGIKIG